MINKTIIAGLVAIAFVAGSMMTVNMADAKKGDNLETFFGLLMELETQIISMQTEILALSTGGTGGTGPQGPQGETGPAGPQGETGPAGEINFKTYKLEIESEPAQSGFAVAGFVRCDPGDVILSGGYRNHSFQDKYYVRTQLPSGTDVWEVQLVITDNSVLGNTFTVVGHCADIAEPFRS